MTDISISVCGCGWLGQPLALQLLHQGHRVLGTCRSEQKRQALSACGIEAWLFQLGAPLPEPITEADILILNIPPSRKTIEPESFVRSMKGLIDQLLTKGCEQILFISTTSVYGDIQGKVDEQTEPAPNTDSGFAHIEIENYLLSTGKASILRLAGLIGPNRHPVKYLAGRTSDHGQQRVNLIHREDVLNAITRIVHRKIRGRVLHLAASEHPGREDYYTWAAEELGLATPLFKSGQSTGKIIDASATLRLLDQELRFPSPFSMPLS